MRGGFGALVAQQHSKVSKNACLQRF